MLYLAACPHLPLAVALLNRETLGKYLDFFNRRCRQINPNEI
jgi:hypothetical protein